MVEPDRPMAVERAVGPAATAFRRRYLKPPRPVVLEGVVDADRAGALRSVAAFAERYADVPVDVSPTEGGRLVQDRARGLLVDRSTVGKFVDALRSRSDPGYLMMTTEALPAAIRGACPRPSYCEGAPFQRSKLWVSGRGAVSPLHRDAPHNLLVQLAGTKRVKLFAPRDTRALYPRPLWSSTPNFSAVDPEAPDLRRHGRFSTARPLECEIAPGDALFIPSGWWHHVRTLEDSISMNFWWAGGVLSILAFATDAYKRMRGLSR